MPWPCCSSVSATSTTQLVGVAQSPPKLLKATMIDGVGVRDAPFMPIRLVGNVPGIWPRSSSTKIALT